MTDRKTYYHSPKERPSRPSDPVKPTGKLVARKGDARGNVHVYELPPIKKKYSNFPDYIADPQDPMRVKNFK